METKQALQIIKEILDAASKAGLFQNLDSSIVAGNAYKVIEANLIYEE
jgi:hypothetical protein